MGKSEKEQGKKCVDAAVTLQLSRRLRRFVSGCPRPVGETRLWCTEKILPLTDSRVHSCGNVCAVCHYTCSLSAAQACRPCLSQL